MSRPHLSSGPVVWVATIAITTLLLAASIKALGLVVPFLLAVLLYYLLFPVVRRLELAGVKRETAAALVAGGVSVIAIAVMVPTVPWLFGQSVSGEEALGRYLEGGRVLIDRTARALESQFGFLRRMDFHAEVMKKADEYGSTFLQQQLAAALLKASVFLPALLLGPFFAFFLLRDGRRFLHNLLGGVPNAFFERTVYMFDQVHRTARDYFQGLLRLAFIDALCLTLGFWLIGVSGAVVLGIVGALLAWIPLIGTVLGSVTIALVAATQFPNDLWIVYAAVGVFLLVRFLDAFVLMPLIVGRSISMHPLPTVLMIVIGGMVAGIPGLILALPLAGVVRAVVATLAAVIDDPRLHARHAYAKALESGRMNADLPR